MQRRRFRKIVRGINFWKTAMHQQRIDSLLSAGMPFVTVLRRKLHTDMLLQEVSHGREESI